MDYEKKYKEALERAKKELQTCGSTDSDAAKQIFRLFPELKESEDGRIRKTLIDYFKNYKTQEEIGIQTFFGIPTDDILAWLEKQGESSNNIHYWTEEEIEPIISDYLRGAEHYGGMIGRLRCLKPKPIEKQGEQKPTDYNEELKKCRENPLYFIDKYVKLEKRKSADKYAIET